MKKSQRLQMIADINAKNEKKALETLVKTQGKKKELQDKLENLQEYRQEYQDKYESISTSGIKIDQLLEFRSFISKLDHAIEEQKKAISTIDNGLIFERKNWEIQHQKTQSLQKVRDSALSEEVKKEERREQNEQDDRAGRVGKNNGIGSAKGFDKDFGESK